MNRTNVTNKRRLSRSKPKFVVTALALPGQMKLLRHLLKSPLLRLGPLLMLLVVMPLHLEAHRVYGPFQQTPETILLDFEDLPLNSSYNTGDVVPMANNTLLLFTPYDLGNGNMATTGGARVIPNSEEANGVGQVLRIGNTNASFLFEGIAGRIILNFGKHGGNVNLEINGERYVGDSFDSLTTIGDVRIAATSEWLILEGNILTFSIGGQEFAIDNVEISLEKSARARPPQAPQAVRLLLITQDNKVTEHHVAIVPGYARGHANQFNQWLVTILDEQRAPLDVYGIWDPRLTLVHRVSPTVHSAFEFDDKTGYLFDIVFPFTTPSDPYAGRIPVEVLLHDQETRMLTDIDLRDAIDEFCARESAHTLRVDFDKPGDEYDVGDRVTNDVTITFLPYFDETGQSVDGGRASVLSETALQLNTINARFTFGWIARRISLQFLASDEGLNLSVNGDQRYAIGSFEQLENVNVGGATVNINRTEKGPSLVLTGPIKTFSIGGRDLYIGDVEIELMYAACFVNLQTFEPLTGLYRSGWNDRPAAVAPPALPLHSAEGARGSYMGDSSAVAGCIAQGAGEGVRTPEEWREWLAECGREVQR